MDLTTLLQGELSALLMPLLLVVRGIRKKFTTSEQLPTLHEAIIVVLMFAAGIGLAYANKAFAGPGAGLVQLWIVQGFIFGAALFLTDLGMDATSVKTTTTGG